MKKVPTKTGVTVRAHEMIYKTVVQTVLLYGSRSWIVTKDMLKIMEGFHHQADQRIAGISYRKFAEGVWEGSLMEEDLEVSGLCPMKEYIQRWQAEITENITNQPIY